jgi:hypothetical protein
MTGICGWPRRSGKLAFARTRDGAPSVRATPLFLETLGRVPMLSPYVAIRPRRGATRAPGRRGRAAGRLAGSFAAELAIEQRLGTDHEDDAHYLHAHREAERSSSAMGRHDMISAKSSSSVIPSKCSTFSAGDQRPPAGPDIGGARPARQSDDAAVLRADDALALSLKRGACHRRRAPRQARSPSRASACVCLQGGLRGGASVALDVRRASIPKSAPIGLRPARGGAVLSPILQF